MAEGRDRPEAEALISLLAVLAVEATDGFSGAEIEQVVVSTLYASFGAGGDVTTEGLVAEARATVPLSVTMAENVSALRAWAAGRAVPAG